MDLTPSCVDCIQNANYPMCTLKNLKVIIHNQAHASGITLNLHFSCHIFKFPIYIKKSDVKPARSTLALYDAGTALFPGLISPEGRV